MKDLAIKIRELAEQYAGYTAENLSRIVQIKSLSTQEKDVQQEVIRQMQEAGFDEIFADGLGNVIGRIGNGTNSIAFDGHVDTVDIGNLKNWDFDPMSGKVADGFVHGRGTVDQKGGIASFITAGRILKDLGYDKNMTVYFVSSVIEEDCDGLCWKYIVEEDKIMPRLVVSTEPTNLNIYRGHRGRMEMQVVFHGVSAHGSAPERGKNAIYMASQAALEIEKLNEKLKHDDFLGKGTITVTQFLSESPSLCAVSDFVQMHLDRRLTWGETKESALAEINDIIRHFDAEVKVLQYEETAYTGQKYGMEKYYPTWKMDESHDSVVKAVASFKNLFDKEPLVDKWTFSTNGVTIKGFYNIPVIGFGPGNEKLAHAPNEKTPISDLVAASAFYALYVYANAENC